jgi:hypothetical protein
MQEVAVVVYFQMERQHILEERAAEARLLEMQFRRPQVEQILVAVEVAELNHKVLL